MQLSDRLFHAVNWISWFSSTYWDNSDVGWDKSDVGWDISDVDWDNSDVDCDKTS